MDTSPDLYLPNRDAIELAWKSVYTTGGAPTLTPLLDSMIDMLPPRQSANRELGASLYLTGEIAAMMKKELAYSLGILAAYSDRSTTVQAASELLHSLEA